MKTLLVTGGAGFIGSNFVRSLMADGYEEASVVVLDALTYAGNLANIQDLIDSRRITFVRGDICDRGLLTRLFETHRFDAVVHFAAESHVDRSILGPQQFIETNVNGTFNLLLAARDCWRGTYEGKRFLHVSTDEVFGTLSPSEPPFNEKTPYAPNSPYSASKAASDHLVRAWHHTYGFPAIITNCSNNYGRWQFPEKLIPLMILNAAEKRDLPVYGDGMQIRDWLHVIDHCEAVRLVLEQGRVGETYCIGGDNELANITIVQRICDLIDERTGRQPGASRRLICHVEDRPGHDRRYAIDAGKIRAELGWRPRFAFESALTDVVDWYLENRAWVETIRSGEYLRFYEDQYGGRLRRVAP